MAKKMPDIATPPRVLVASGPPSEEAIRDLTEFLQQSRRHGEKALHRLFENHPTLLGSLGFEEFVSEQPLQKRVPDALSALDLRADRADFLAARVSPLLSVDGRRYKSAHVIELKRADATIASRHVGSRLSPIANQAIEQAREYARWLTEVQDNRALLASIGWDVRNPTIHVLMGRIREFARDPGQLEEMRGRFLDLGVVWWTLDEVLGRATRAHEQAHGTIWVCAVSERDEVLATVQRVSWPRSVETLSQAAATLAELPNVILAHWARASNSRAPIDKLIAFVKGTHYFSDCATHVPIHGFEDLHGAIRLAVKLMDDEIIGYDRLLEYKPECREAATFIELVSSCFGAEFEEMYARYYRATQSVPTYKASLVANAAHLALQAPS